jgi:hypothetical protein
MLDIWPPFPIVIEHRGHEYWRADDIIAALEHNDRICDLILYDIPSPEMDKFLAAMQQPFPALTRLWLWSRDETTPVDPASFLGIPHRVCKNSVWMAFHFRD